MHYFPDTNHVCKKISFPLFQSSFYKSAWGILRLMVQFSKDIFDHARYNVKSASSNSSSSKFLTLWDHCSSAVPNLLNVTFLALYQVPLEDLKPLLPDLIEFQKSSAHLELGRN
jgi:hypothetical protein